MKRIFSKLALLIIGAAIGVLTVIAGYPTLRNYFPSLGAGESGNETAAPVATEKKPLYWVAPMDPNYRRDKPGKSPMGMDLIPFYGEEGGGPDEGPGTVKISPDVVNNLGVRTATAQLGSLQPIIQTVGYVKYNEDRLVHIHPRVSGWIEELYVKAEGDPVKKGEPLYNLYSPELVNAQEELIMALDRKRPRLITAAEDRLASLRVSAQAIRQLKNTKEVKQTIIFYAPQSGVVDNLQIRQGFYVKPGSTIMSIASLAQVWVDAEVFERQASEVAVGQPVIMTLDFLPGRQWSGVVDYVYPTLDTKTRTLGVRLRFANDERLLKPGMFAQVIIHLDNSGKSLLVPKEAVIRTGRSSRVVLALGDGHFKSINVKVGRVDDRSAEILAGLKEGEKIVTSAQFLIDSESSKTSAFKRMNHNEGVAPDSVWVEATINSLMADRRMVNVSHKAIPAWNWPAMKMNFTVAEDVDLSALKPGMTVQVEISKVRDDQYRIIKIHLPGKDDNKSLEDLNMDDMGLDDMSLDTKKHDDHKQ